MEQPIHRSVIPVALLAAVLLAQACRVARELPPPTPDQTQQITAAINAYLKSQATDGTTLTLRDVASGADRTVQIGQVGRPQVARSRYFLVPAQATIEGQETVNVAFFVLQTGPIFVVDTAVIAPTARVRFGP